MSAPISVEELLALIRKSGVVEDEKLASYLRCREFTGGVPTVANELAIDMIREGVLTNFQVEQFLLGKWRGFTIGKYKLLERVGVGGMGQVFLCEHLELNRRVAIKILPPAKAEQPAALGRFYREARAAACLDHPNIIRTHAIDRDGDLHFIVMDYVAGPNLLDVVKKFGPMDIGRAVSYVRQVAYGLDYAFRSGIIHRDVKPGNILIDRHGVARILDMGLARFFTDHTDQLTLKYDDKIVLGTADYVAPEQVANSHAVDIRADIYALGATLYFLLAGHPPFPTGTVSQKLLWHRTKEPAPIRAVRPDVPDGLAAVLAKMMAKDAKSRYHTPAQVAAELDCWVPENVPLPRGEEMPQLSPAAGNGAGGESTTDELDMAYAGGAASSSSETARATFESATAILTGSSVPAPSAPFGPTGGFPWGVPAGVIAPFADTADQHADTPDWSAPTPVAAPSQLHPGLHPHPSAAAAKPWALIAAIAIAILSTAALIISHL